MSYLNLSILAASSALISVACLLGFQFYFARQRQRRFDSFELIPNILMTRFPLLFVGQPRSLFHLSGDFLELPIYLQEHGYKVEEIEIQHSRNDVATLLRLLDTSRQPVHLIVSDTFADAAYDVAFDGHANLATLTMIGDLFHSKRRTDLRPTRRPIFERPDLRPSIVANTFFTEEIALKHMVSLAEFDLR